MSHLDLHCFHRHPCWSAVLKGKIFFHSHAFSIISEQVEIKISAQVCLPSQPYQRNEHIKERLQSEGTAFSGIRKS